MSGTGYSLAREHRYGNGFAYGPVSCYAARLRSYTSTSRSSDLS